MEYVHGVSLSGVLERARTALSAPLPWPVVVRIATYLCEVLEYAHGARALDGTPLRLVHRDVNPSNVLLTHSGALKLLDFGAARAASNTHHTPPGVVRAKLEYAAPEQYRGAPGDVRVDVYGVGITLYELLSGTMPLRQATARDTLQAVLSLPLPKPSRTGLPRRLRAVVLAATAKAEADRPSTMHELRAALERCLLEAREWVGMPELAALMEQLFPGAARLAGHGGATAGADAPTDRQTAPLGTPGATRGP
jgi:serine/threonine-protein kinase